MLLDSVRIQRDLIKSYGFDYAENIFAGNVEDQYPKALEHHNVEYIVKGAIDFLDIAPKDQPFFSLDCFHNYAWTKRTNRNRRRHSYP